MNGQVIKTYSKRKPVALFKTESKLVPSITKLRLSKIRESQLNDKTLEIGTFDDTFDRLVAGVDKPPSSKNSPKQVDLVGQVGLNQVVFKVPRQTQKSYGKKNKQTLKYDENRNEEEQNTDKNSISDKNNTVKRKRLHSDSSDDGKTCNTDVPDSDKEEAPYFVERKAGGAKKKRKLSHTKESKNDIKLKKCTVPLQRFKLGTNTIDNEVSTAENKADKENVSQSNDSFLKVPESWKHTDYLTSTPFQNRRLNVCLDNISPIALNKVSQNSHSRGSPLKNSINTENRNAVEKSMNLSNISQSLFSSRENDYSGMPVNFTKSVNGNKINPKSFVDSPLLFEDTLTNDSNKSNISTASSLKNIEKPFNTIKISFDSSVENIKILENQDSGEKMNPRFYESSYIPDDWTNDYNSSYEYYAEKKDDKQVVESTTKNVEDIPNTSCTKDKDNDFENSTSGISSKNASSLDKQNLSIERSMDSKSIEKETVTSKSIENDFEQSCDNSLQSASKFSEKSQVINDTIIENVLESMSEEGILKNCTLDQTETSKFSSDDRNNDTSSSKISNEKVVLDVSKMGGQESLDKCVKEIKSIVDLCPKKLFVLLPKLNYDDIKNKLQVRSRTPSNEKQLNNTKRKSSRLSSQSNKDRELGSQENNLPIEESPNASMESISSADSANDPKKNNNFDMDGSELELRANLLKMKGFVKVTQRRVVRKRLDKSLEAIAENVAEPSFGDTNESKTSRIKSLGTKISVTNKHSDEKALTNDEYDNNIKSLENRAVFLKSGKSWARSLSIINNFHNKQHLDELAIGRGKSWTQSIQTILNMQPDGNGQKDGDRESDGKINPTVLQNRVSSIPLSPTRFSKRFSIRIIPSGKRSTLTDDFFNSNRLSSRNNSISRKTSLSAFYIEYCRKIGEGVYGEVFLHDKDDVKSVIKIIPIEGDQLVNCEPQKKFHEILSEIIISEELHELRRGDIHNTNGFVGVNRIMCVIGKYPNKLVDLWNVYDKEKKSENDCPTMFGDEQLFIILELAHGGQDLEVYRFQNAAESYSIFLQISYSLAVAEQSLEFEHRDLHWGNVLISKTEEKNLSFKLNNDEISLPTKGVKVSVIDFTLSRMSYKGCKIFNDLALDPTLFAAQGEYQFDIYRMMRDSVNNDWQQFKPHTNVLWLDYTLEKMITAARYKKKTTKIHKTAISHMKKLRKTLLNYQSASDFVSNCEKL
ncbi:uncharacterized protein LOC106640222, partial [Copidosoma floridanum]|uniref:uncharacterized protein LOC106640222 n=1 Tax=Copidosoma floridanum TaxID=29053 RepID=UPI000C6F9C68